MSSRPATVATHAAFMASGFTVYRPSGWGPFPVSLQFHGCGGVQPFQKRYAEAAVKAGVAVVVVDSFRPRGMSRLDGSLFVCTGAALRGAQRAADLHAALHWLRGQAWADADRVFAAGWSHGGWTIMDAFAQQDGAARMTGLADAGPGALKPIRGALLVYPWASFPSLTSGRGWGAARPRVWSILGGQDQVVGDRHPRRALERLQRDGLSVETLHFPEATHAFDDDHANDPRTRFNPARTAEAEAFYVGALKAALF